MSVSASHLRTLIAGALLMLWTGCAWCQNLALFPKEDILLIGGDFRLRSIHSNMGAADETGGGESGGFPVTDSATKSFFDTRLRLYWDFRPSELMRVHYRMEIGDVRFGGCDGVDCDSGSDVSGNLLPPVGPGAGGGVGADGVNVETKNVFLDVTLPFVRGLSFRGGIFGYGDRYDFNILADDFAGLQLNYRRGDVAAHLVYLKFFEGDSRDSADDSDWIGIDAEYKLSAHTSVASSFHYWLGVDRAYGGDPDADPFQYWAGLEVTSRIGQALLNGYAIFNQGEGYFGRRSGTNSGVNVSVSGDYYLDFGTLGLQAQYITGEAGSKSQLERGDRQDADIGAWLSYKNHVYQGPGIISRGPIVDIGDGFSSKWGTGNGYLNGDYGGRLLIIARGAFPVLKAKYGDTLTLHLTGAYDMAAAENASGDRHRGIETNVWAHVNLMPKLWLRLGAAYYLTGDWWKDNTDASYDGYGMGPAAGSDPDDVWQLSLRLQYDFG